MAIRYYGSASDLNPAPFLAAASRTFNKSRVLLASRSNRVTSSTSPVPRASIAFVSAFRSATAPETEETLVPQWAKMADRMRGAQQRGQAATRSRSLPLQRLGSKFVRAESLPRCSTVPAASFNEGFYKVALICVFEARLHRATS